MDRKSVIRRFITDTKNWIIGYGAEFLNKSDDSDSLYLNVGGTKVRISDHFSGFVSDDQINVIFPVNNPANPIVIYNSAVMSYPSFKELKCFLKSFCEMRVCEYFTKDAKLDSKILQKQAKYNILNESVKKKSMEADKLSKKLASETNMLERTCSKIKKLTGNIGENGEIDVSGLSKNQKKQIMDLILSYKH